MSEVVVHPEVELESRDSDVPLEMSDFLGFSLFKNLKSAPPVVKYPGSLKLRFYEPGEAIVRQGEPGYTCFYLLAPEDFEVSRLRESVTKLNSPAMFSALRTPPQREAGIVGIQQSRPQARTKPARRTWWPWANSQRVAARPDKQERNVTIPFDGPTLLGDKLTAAVLHPGDLFGELSCIDRTPRSATIYAISNVFLIEITNNIFVQFRKDTNFANKMNSVYKQRVLNGQLRQMSFFQRIPAKQLEQVRDQIELLTLKAGEIMMDEYDPPEAMYIIRSGIIKVAKNLGSLIRREDIYDWEGLIRRLRDPAPATAPESSPATPNAMEKTTLGNAELDLAPLRAYLLPATRDLLRQIDPKRFLQAPKAIKSQIDEEKWRILDGLNEIIKKLPDLRDAKIVEKDPILGKYKQHPLLSELRDVMAVDEFQQRLKTMDSDRKKWTDVDIRRCNRWLLDVVFSAAMHPKPFPTGAEVVLNYRGSSEFLGEGVLTGSRRIATCVAYSHPGGSGEVQVARIPATVVKLLMEANPQAAEEISEVAKQRRKETVERTSQEVWKSNEMLNTGKYAELGLIYGQKLMLIDLERCTRCDECVNACVNNHDDGRTRLILDGPRIGKYLIPSTCRSCIDPVCMIGCPVSSIHRGGNNEIVIENWCIGCDKCAKQCPYDAIQMGDIGLIHEYSLGWRYILEDQIDRADRQSGAWPKAPFRDRDWLVGHAPFHFNQALRDSIGRPPFGPSPDRPGGEAFLFRYPFQLTPDQLQDSEDVFLLTLTTCDPNATPYTNGIAWTKVEKKTKGDYKGEIEFTLAGEETEVTRILVPGRNVLAVRARHIRESTFPLLQARLDLVHRRGKNVEKTVTHQAVVCDLCSTVPGQLPACVHACPHEAAIRVNARTEFPL